DLPRLFELATLDGTVLPFEDWPLRRILRGDIVDAVELSIRRLRPSWTRIFRYSGSRVCHAGHESLAFLTVNDITERKQTEAVRQHAQHLADRERAFSQAMIESMPGVLYLYDERGRFLRWNRNFATVSGYTDEEIARMHPLGFFAGTDRERVAREIHVVFEQG